MNHADLSRHLRQSFQTKTKTLRQIRLPSQKHFRAEGDTEAVTIWLSAAAAAGNMQDDASAFEGWALVLMAWCGVRRVTIDWEQPAEPSGHYQRFLYRVERFVALLGPEVLTVREPHRLAASKMSGGCTPTLNLASGVDSLDTPSRPGSEAELEKRLAGADSDARSRLMSELGLALLDRQMPVGVYDGPPRTAAAIFTGGKSAIDLVGIGQDASLWLLELKTAANVKVGALSELFFYAMVLQDVRKGRIVFHNGKAGLRATITPVHVLAAPRIHARVISEARHPLLGPDVFSIMTNAARSRGWPVDFGHHDLSNCLSN